MKSEEVPDVKPEDNVVVSESDVASQEVVSTTVPVTSPTTTNATTTLTSPVVKTESASPISTSKSCLPMLWCLPNFNSCLCNTVFLPRLLFLLSECG